MIKVTKKNEEAYMVTVQEEGSQTEHTVTLEDGYYQKLTGGKITKEMLIEKSFEFLLAREPKESILCRFNLKVISTYFPQYENKISIT